MNISLIAALTKNRVIGKDNGIPWSLPNDMKYFKNTTLNHVVIMGRKNWESIPEKYRPLPNRTNIIVTRNMSFGFVGTEVRINHSIEAAIEDAGRASVCDIRYKTTHDTLKNEIFIIGGGEIYASTISMANKLYLTEINAEVEGDIFFPEVNMDEWVETSRVHNGVDEKHAYEYDFVVYERK